MKTFGEIVRAMDRETLEKSFLLLFGICDFYANPDTYVAVSFLTDPPCGDIVRDFGPAPGYEGFKPGRRGRLALHWIIQSMKILYNEDVKRDFQAGWNAWCRWRDPGENEDNVSYLAGYNAAARWNETHGDPPVVDDAEEMADEYVENLRNE